MVNAHNTALAILANRGERGPGEGLDEGTFTPLPETSQTSFSRGVHLFSRRSIRSLVSSEP